MPFDRDFIQTLEQLAFLAKRLQRGTERGEHDSIHKGESVEFADYRPYAAGDEIRRVDWNVFARHDQLFVREFSATRTMHLTILIDSSASMEVGNPSKFDSARRLAAALAYIGLSSFDTTSVHHFRDTRSPVRAFMKGRHAIFDLLDDLERLRTEGQTRLSEAFHTPLPRLRGGSILVIVSDFYDFVGTHEVLTRFKSQYDRVYAVHLEAKEDYESIQGRFRMTDPESGASLDLSVTRPTFERYRRAVQDYGRSLQEFCQKSEVYYLPGMSGDSLEDWIVRLMATGALLKKG